MKRSFVILLLLILLFSLSACGLKAVRGPTKKVLYTDISLLTQDNLTLSASYYDSDSTKGLIFAHMLSRDRHTFDSYAEELQEYYKIVSLDLRGHGESDEDFVSFNDADFNDMIYDLESAADYLQSEGVAEENISFVGASIGANIVIKYADVHPVDKLVAISPGSRLRGIDLSRKSFSKEVLVQVGNYDAYSAISVDDFETLWSNGHFLYYDASGHGTDLLKNDLSAHEDFLFYMT